MAEVRRGGSKSTSLAALEAAATAEVAESKVDDFFRSSISGQPPLSCIPLRGLDADTDFDAYRHQFMYIDHGYRHGYTLWELFLSLFSFHNETSNIWSHLIGFFCVTIVGMQKWVGYHASPAPDAGASAGAAGSEGAFSPWGDFFLQVYIVCAAACLALSFTYHWFGCFSEAYHRNLLRLDLTGVGLLVAGSFFPSMFYNFHCKPDLQHRYLWLSVFVLVAGLVAPWVEVRINGLFIRHYLFAALVFLGTVPCFHWYLVTPDEYREPLLLGVTLLFFWYGTGFLVFIARVPERWFPKSLFATMITPSHTIWHLCVLAAIYVWFGHIIASQQLLAKMGCVPYNDR